MVHVGDLGAGKHTLKYGADVRLLRETSINYGNSAGSYTFGTNWTRGPLDNAASAPNGQAFASLLLGLPTAGQFDVNTDRDNHAFYSAFFFQDDWRPRSDLTINLGLRYERETGTVERYDRTLVGFDETSANSVTAAARAAYAANPQPGLPVSDVQPGRWTDLRVLVAPQRLQHARRRVLAAVRRRLHAPGVRRQDGVPRRLRDLLRHLRDDGRPAARVQPVDAVRATLDGFLTPAATLSNPFPGGILQPVDAARGLDQNLGQTLTYTNSSVAQPFSRRYTAGVQQQLGSGIVLEGTYAVQRVQGLAGLHRPKLHASAVP